MSEHLRLGWMSDIDGTAVQLADSKYSLQNALKSPLAPAKGFRNFVFGTQSGDVPFLGYISRRPNVWQRNRATEASLQEIGLPQRSYIHAGTLRPWDNHENLKARAVVRAAAGFDAFGFIDDKPHKIGRELISAISAVEHHPATASVHIVLGAVAQNGNKHLEQLWDSFDSAQNARPSETFASYRGNHGYLEIGDSALHVVTIEELSTFEGSDFAYRLRQIATEG